MLEGGYDLDALTASTAAVLGVLAGLDHAAAERSTAGGPGAEAVDAVHDQWHAGAVASRLARRNPLNVHLTS